MKTLTVPWPIFVLFLLVLPFQALAQGLAGAHAHNDYYHPRPLLDALSHGFCSVEADIFLVDGQLLVGHDEEELIQGRTLEALYLEPLRQRVGQRGSVQGQGCDFSLLIDVKSDGNQTWEQLETLLGEYRSILTRFSDDEVQKGAVTVLISGNRSASRMLRKSTRLAGLDGRLADLTLGLTPAQMPWISDDFTRYFSWQGRGEMPAEERELLKRIVEVAHRLGFRLRFWATPDDPVVWRELQNAGVDLIGADDLSALQGFLKK